MDNIVYIINIETDKKPGRTAPYKYGVESWRKWCHKNNAKLVVLDQAILPYEDLRPNWHKVFIFDLLEQSNIEVNKIIIVDADTIVHPDAPNFFEMDDGKFCVVPNIGSYDWIFRSVENYKKHIFNNYDFDVTKYFNSCFMILNKNHRYFLEKVKQFYFSNKDNLIKMQETFFTGTDQPVLNFMCQIENIDMKFLPYEFNMQDLHRREGLTPDMPYINLGYIYHFNAIPNNKDNVQTIYWMEKTYKSLYESR
jgi:hypothetical protein